jgi:hypothetical protein
MVGQQLKVCARYVGRRYLESAGNRAIWRALPGETKVLAVLCHTTSLNIYSPSRVGSLSCNRASGIPPSSHNSTWQNIGTIGGALK